MKTCSSLVINYPTGAGTCVYKINSPVGLKGEKGDDLWPIKISWTPSESGLIVRAKLLSDNKNVCSLSCLLKKINKEIYYVDAFTIGDNL